MVRNREVPIFPPRAVIERVLELGFLSGAWKRQELTDKWGDSVANSFIQNAKEFGWLVSPFSNEFYVPPAQDLMVVCWLPQPQRQEFVISRTLAATRLRYWCLSAWMRERGLDLPEPVFVTDLAPAPPLGQPIQGRRQPPPSAAEIKERTAKAAKSLRRIPFISNLVLVPELPQTSRSTRPETVLIPRGISRKPFRYGWLLEENSFPERPSQTQEESRPSDVSGREIRFTLSPRIDDSAWTVALLIAIGLPRIREAVPSIVEREVRRELFIQGKAEQASRETRRIEDDYLRRVQNWAAYFGQAAPNEGWHKVLSEGVFPYLLVPWGIWMELSSQASTRGFQATQNLKQVMNARSRSPG